MKKGADIRETKTGRDFRSVFELVQLVVPAVSILMALYVLGVGSLIVWILADCLYLVCAWWLSSLYSLCITHKLMVSYPFLVVLDRLLENAGIACERMHICVWALAWLVILGGAYKLVRRYIIQPMQIKMGDKRADKYRQDLYALRERRKSVMPDR